MAIGYLDMPPAFQRREHHEQVSRAVAPEFQVTSKQELAERVLAAIEDVNQQPMCILGLTNSKALLNMIRFSETLY